MVDTYRVEIGSVKKFNPGNHHFHQLK